MSSALYIEKKPTEYVVRAFPNRPERLESFAAVVSYLLELHQIRNMPMHTWDSSPDLVNLDSNEYIAITRLQNSFAETLSLENKVDRLKAQRL